MAFDPKLNPEEVYKEVGAMYRYALGWRDKLFGGYFVLLAGLAIGFAWLHEHRRHNCWMMLAGASVMSVIFLCLEIRNRTGYRNCRDAGAALERQAGIDEEAGLYRRLGAMGQKDHWWRSHSFVLNVMFGALAIFFAV